MITSTRQVSEVKSTMVVSRYDVFTISTPSHWVGPGGVEIMNMSNLLAMMVEFTSESWY